MSNSTVMKLRAASNIEKRFVVRHALGWYRALIITGLYTVDNDGSLDIFSVNSYIPALKWCIEAHPLLSATMHGVDTEAPEYVRPATLDLRNHIHIIDTKSSRYVSAENELDLLKQITLETHDQPWENANRIPPWKIVVVPLPDQADSTEKRVYIIYAYSHTHGDGKSGLAFHRSFLQGLQSQAANQRIDQDFVYQTPQTPLPLPIEEACNLKISWSFLLSPLLSQYLPGFVCRLFNFQASATSLPTTHVYVGEAPRYDPENSQTQSEILVVKQELLAKVLAACRSQRAKFTGLLNQLVVHALSEALPSETGLVESFIGQIVIDLRSQIPAISDDTVGNYVSATFVASPRSPKSDGNSRYNEAFWAAVRDTTSRLAQVANTLDDQPIGLLKYLRNFRSWFLENLSKSRDSSYEISNIGVFDPSLPPVEGSAAVSTSTTIATTQNWNIRRMLFSQPFNVLASPLNFQVVTMKGADMVIALNWQAGVLGVADENTFTREILKKIEGGLAKVASSSL